MPDQNLTEPSSGTRSPAKPINSGSSVQVATKPNLPHTAHVVLQGKGGVGKSYIASLIAQYLRDQDRLDSCFDTDPVNGSFQSIGSLQVRPVALLEDDAIHVKGIDMLIEAIIAAKKDVVVDNGAASFLPLSRYLIDNDIPAFLKGHGVKMTVHSVVTGGANGLDTLAGLDALIPNFTPAAQLVVWVNEFLGPVRFSGIDFEETPVFEQNRSKIHGLVYLRKLDPVMFAPNLADMLNRKMTFAEAATSDQFVLMEKSRLFRIKTGIWSQLAEIV